MRNELVDDEVLMQARAFSAALASELEGGEENRFQGMPSDADSRHVYERLGEAGWIGLHWPQRLGGRDLGPLQTSAVEEVFGYHWLPLSSYLLSVKTIGNALLRFAAPDLVERLLPQIASGELVFCQGFSEPDHGSDLAGVQTRAEVDGDEIVVTGQKVWTSGAARANMMFALCRSDPDAPKHKGLAYVLIPFTGPGVQYRPIRQMSGASEFCEDFLDGVRAPLFNVIGGLNNGWRVAMTTLGHERGGQATTAHLGYEREFWELVDTARKYGKTADPLVRQQLAAAFTGVQLMRFGGLRTLAEVAQGRPPGPEASVAKLFWSEYHKRLGELAISIVGADALLRPEGDGYPTTAWQNVFLSSRAGTIYSGTSEIQRNIIGERGLGLPKEPKVAG